MVTTTPTEEEIDLDAIFGALSNQTRRGMLRSLTVADATISELAKPLDMTLPAVSKHLRVLERAGLVSRTRDGKAHRCALHPEVLDAAEEWFAERRAFWTDNLDSLVDYFNPDESDGAE
jgi:DNA-binding transcriptional ArsR family regulator